MPEADAKADGFRFSHLSPDLFISLAFKFGGWKFKSQPPF